jgi:hypothetical protein
MNRAFLLQARQVAATLDVSFPDELLLSSSQLHLYAGDHDSLRLCCLPIAPCPTVSLPLRAANPLCAGEPIPHVTTLIGVLPLPPLLVLRAESSFQRFVAELNLKLEILIQGDWLPKLNFKTRGTKFQIKGLKTFQTNF